MYFLEYEILKWLSTVFAYVYYNTESSLFNLNLHDLYSGIFILFAFYLNLFDPRSWAESEMMAHHPGDADFFIFSLVVVRLFRHWTKCSIVSLLWLSTYMYICILVWDSVPFKWFFINENIIIVCRQRSYCISLVSVAILSSFQNSCTHHQSFNLHNFDIQSLQDQAVVRMSNSTIDLVQHSKWKAAYERMNFSRTWLT